MSLTAGARLGPYEILAPLGAGGMGEVYRARDTRLGRDVAVKILPAALAAHADRLARFGQEARAAGALNHPNILAIYDLGTHGDLPYIVSELLEGQTLRDRIAQGPLPARKATDLAAQMARGLAAAHERGIVHRDLKPENVFVTRDGRAKVLDFGLAKLLERDPQAAGFTNLPTTPARTEAGVVMGTVGYMAPEQVRGQAADPRSDLFALGAILYEMLSGRRAFAGDSAVEAMHAILKDDPPDLAPAGGAVSPALERIVRHCLEKSPEERFQSARDVAFLLESLHGTPTPGSGTPAIGRVRASKRARLALAAVAVLAVAGALVAGLLLGRRSGLRPASSAPTFERLTFRQGFVHSARFTRDGQGIVYSAAWEGKPLDVYLARLGTPESRPLGLASWNLLAVSPLDELAVSRITKSGGSNLYRSAGTLARLPLTGGSPRDVADDVMYADWSPDGTSLAIVRDLGDRRRLEFPIGKVLHETPHYLFNPRISPDGRQVALWDTFFGQSSLVVVDPLGTIRTLSQGWYDWWYLSWSPDGREIWFGASVLGFAGDVYAVDLAGHRRPLYSGPGAYDVQDVFRDGRALFGSVKQRMRTTGLLKGWGQERELFWFDGTTVVDISKDGTAVLLAESSEAGGRNGSALLQRNDGSPPVRLGEGRPLAMSPDGRWALAASARDKLIIQPIGVGEARPVGAGVFEAIDNAGWLPDGKRIAVVANEPGKHMRLYLLDVDGGGAKPLGDEGIEFGSSIAVSPDARLVAAVATDGRLVLLPTAGGPPESGPGIQAGDRPITWSEDGRALYVVARETAPATIWRIDLRTGRREPWKELAVQDRAGVSNLRAVVLSQGSQSYCYTYQQFLTDLYLVDGLK